MSLNHELLGWAHSSAKHHPAKCPQAQGPASLSTGNAGDSPQSDLPHTALCRGVDREYQGFIQPHLDVPILAKAFDNFTEGIDSSRPDKFMDWSIEDGLGVGDSVTIHGEQAEHLRGGYRDLGHLGLEIGCLGAAVEAEVNQQVSATSGQDVVNAVFPDSDHSQNVWASLVHQISNVEQKAPLSRWLAAPARSEPYHLIIVARRMGERDMQQSQCTSASELECRGTETRSEPVTEPKLWSDARRAEADTICASGNPI